MLLREVCSGSLAGCSLDEPSVEATESFSFCQAERLSSTVILPSPPWFDAGPFWASSASEPPQPANQASSAGAHSACLIQGFIAPSLRDEQSKRQRISVV